MGRGGCEPADDNDHALRIAVRGGDRDAVDRRRQGLERQQPGLQGHGLAGLDLAHVLLGDRDLGFEAAQLLDDEDRIALAIERPTCSRSRVVVTWPGPALSTMSRSRRSSRWRTSSRSRASRASCASTSSVRGRPPAAPGRRLLGELVLAAAELGFGLEGSPCQMGGLCGLSLLALLRNTSTFKARSPSSSCERRPLRQPLATHSRRTVACSSSAWC